MIEIFTQSVFSLNRLNLYCSFIISFQSQILLFKWFTWVIKIPLNPNQQWWDCHSTMCNYFIYKCLLLICWHSNVFFNQNDFIKVVYTGKLFLFILDIAFDIFKQAFFKILILIYLVFTKQIIYEHFFIHFLTEKHIPNNLTIEMHCEWFYYSHASVRRDGILYHYSNV